MSTLALNVSNANLGFTLSVNQTLDLHGITGILGHSGSGKTTLLMSIAGLNKETNGSIYFDDQALLDSDSKHFIAPEQRNISLVFQDARLFPHLNVVDNLNFAIKRCQHSRLALSDIIELTQIAPLLNKRVDTISSGEKQRVALARAILAEPKLLLLDEPLSALDQKSKSLLLSLLKQVHQQLNLPMFYVSHHLDEIQQLADKLLVLEQGQVLHYGNVHQVIHQLNHSGLIAQQTSLSLPIVEQDNQHGITSLQIGDQQIHLLTTQLKQQVQPGQELRCYIFANEISISRQEPVASSIVNQLKAQIADIDTINNQTLVQLICDNQTFFASISSYSLEKLALAKAQWVYIQFKASAVRT
ncbi:molybdenum import ATP-binding protein ModC [Thalassotalea insulae]|uniref:Molybdenum import ATP-binding protein ModC n=1 Tax=Thalassotalea insulae TaxID=2056778 RepID=A0ABQ6GQS0_9GAMM|nr:molybdenum ABC transporter ATP-binding protein [Thalassotalea insulae]GLX77689.1 molybdenum import ATP-binding protein ModC [Thalassotalea insulae]